MQGSPLGRSFRKFSVKIPTARSNLEPSDGCAKVCIHVPVSKSESSYRIAWLQEVRPDKQEAWQLAKAQDVPYVTRVVFQEGPVTYPRAPK